MQYATWRQWLNRTWKAMRRGGSRRVAKPRDRAYRPQLENLEDRLVPAVLTVNTTTDNTTSDGVLTLREAILLVNQGGTANNALGRSLSAGESAQINTTQPFGTNDTIQFDNTVFTGGQTISAAFANRMTQTTLSAAITATQTTFTVASASQLAAVAPDNAIRIDSENMLVTAVDYSTNTLTVTRAQNGTTGAAHASGAAANSAVVGATAFVISTSLTINGPSGINGLTVTAAQSGSTAGTTQRLFTVATGAALTLNNLTLTGGTAVGGAGAIATNTGFGTGNGGGGGGGAGLGGAILNTGTLNLSGVTLRSNSATGGAGASATGSVYLSYGGGGGGIGSDAVSPGNQGGGTTGGRKNNAGGFGGGGGGAGTSVRAGKAGGFGGGGGGGYYYGSGGAGGFAGGGGGGDKGGAGGTAGYGAGAGGAGSSNNVHGAGGGGAGMGGALFNLGGAVTITNSTLTGNTATGGAAGASRAAQGNGTAGKGLGGAISSLNGSVTIINSTISSNTAANDARGLFVYSGAVTGVTSTSATVSMLNSILGQATNTVTDFKSFGSPALSGATNIISNNSGFSGGSVTGTIIADPKLSALASNGGPTQTMSPQSGSPATGAGTLAGAPATDQRGAPRSAPIDIGAYQRVTSTLTLTVSPTATGGPAVNFLVDVGPHFAGSNATGTVTLFDGTTSLGTLTLTSGTATFSYASLFVDPSSPTASHTITANYSGDSFFAAGSVQASSPAFTSAVSAQLREGASGGFTFTVSGNLAATYTETAALPSGVTLNGATGVLSGTPAVGTAGAYPLSITASNGIITNATQSFTLTVGLSPTFTSGATTTFTAGTAGAFTVTTSASPSATITTSSTLPSGVTLTAGVLSGTPGAATGGAYALVFTAHNGNGADATQNFTLNVNQQTAFTNGTTATFSESTFNSFTLTASGYPAASFNGSGSLPLGVTLNSTTGVIGGTPSVNSFGTYNLTLTAHNGVGSDATQNFTLNVNQPIAFTSPTSVALPVFSTNTFTVMVRGVPLPTLTESGSLPSGVTFDAPSGTLGGSPAPGTQGTYALVFTASNGVLPSATQNFSLYIGDPPAFTSTNAATFTVGAPGSFTVAASGDPIPTLSESGALPSGVTFDPSSGILAGTPAVGTGRQWNILFTAHNGSGPDATQSFALSVNEPPAITSGTSFTFFQGVASSFTVATSGFPASTITESGALPTGVTFNNGVLSGAPAPGSFISYNLTFSAANGVGSTATQNFQLVVFQAPTFTSPNNTTFVAGSPGSFTVVATAVPGPPTLTQSGPLPSGVTFNPANGVLAGTPAAGVGASGIYNLSFTAHSGVGADATQAFVFTVNEQPSIGSASGTTFAEGVAGTFTVTATGFPLSSFSETGTLPSGITLNATTGVLGGTAAVNSYSGSPYTLTLTASNGIGTPGTQSFQLTINQLAAVTSANSTAFTVGTAGSFTVTAAGFPASTLSETGTLPAGVTFDPATNILGGTPAVGTGRAYNLVFTAHNGASPDATQAFTLTVNEAPAFTNGTSTTFSEGIAGSFTFTTTGFPAPTFAQLSSLPSGVSLNSTTGILSGTPAFGSNGVYSLPVTAHNGVGSDASQTFVLTVNQPASVTSGPSVRFLVGAPGSFTITAVGSPAATLTQSGTLPSGVTFNPATNVLSGTPGAATGRAYNLSFTAHNGIGTDSTQNFTLFVDQPPAITSAGSITILENTPTNFTVTATGYPNVTFIESGALPSGVSFNAATGVLSGTPATNSFGNYPIVFTGHNGVGVDSTQNFTFTTTQAPIITTANNTTFLVGTAGSFTILATGFPAPSFTETGTLPAGVTLNSTSGVLAGTPAVASGGAYSFTITAANGAGANFTQSFTLTVNENLSITSAASTQFLEGTNRTFTVTAIGFPVPTYSVSGTLPSGVTFSPVTHVLGGTPAANSNGNYPLVFSVTNGGVTTSGTQNFTLTVNQAPVITSVNSTIITIGTFGAFTVTATGFPLPTLSESGALPTGVSFNAVTNVLSGTPAAGTGGVYSLIFTAANGAAANFTQNFSLQIGTTPIFTSAASANVVVGLLANFTLTASGTPAPTFASSALPSGLTLNASSGLVTGTPTAGTQGISTVNFTAINGIGIPPTQSFTLTVNLPPTFSNAASSTFQVGAAGAFTLTTLAFPAPTLSMSGTLPTGLTFNPAAGAVSGTPAARTAGTYNVAFTAANGFGSNATQFYSLTVAFAPSVTSSSSAAFQVGTAGAYTVTGTGFPAATFSESGALPTGVSFNASSGVLSGTPVSGSAGSYPLTFTASNGVGAPATMSFTLSVTQLTAPAITSGGTTTFFTSNAGSFTVTATGNPAPTFAAAGTLPAGVSLNGATGVLSGTPASNTAGTYNLTVFAHNGIGLDDNQAFTLTVKQSSAITSGASATFTTSVPGTFIVNATGSPTPSLSVSGSLPAGITFNPATRILGGTPAANAGGTYPLTFTASNGVVASATQSFTLTVNQPLAFTSTAGAVFTRNVSNTFTVTASGFPLPTFTRSGSLPSGVTFNATSGVLSGTPTVATSASLTFTARNSAGNSVTQAFSLTVAAFTNLASTTFTVGQSNSFAVTTTGFSPAPTYSVSGTLPSGVTFNAATQTLGGTPAAGQGGVYNLTFRASNAVGALTQSFTLTVNEHDPITSSSVSNFRVGSFGSFTITTQGFPLSSVSESGALPSGVSFTPGAGTALISGTPAAGTGGLYQLVITAGNGIGSDDVQDFVLTVSENAALTSATSATFSAGSANSFSVSTVGFPTPILNLSGSLPAGVSFDPASGLLSGTPTAGGVYPLSFTAINNFVAPATQDFTLTVIQTPVLLNVPGGSATVGSAYSFQYQAQAYPAPGYSLLMGALPAGLSLSATGLLSGTPTVAGTYSAVIQANNAVGSTAQAVSIVVDPSTVAPPLEVLAFTPTPTGFTAQFNQAFDARQLNLYDSRFVGLGAPDVTVVQDDGNAVTGTLLVDTAHNRISFVQTGGLLTPGDYTVTFRSASNGFVDLQGGLLAGDGSTPGTSYQQTMTVADAVATTPTLSIPDFARGPDSSATINAPMQTGNGIPITLSNAATVSDATFTLSYDPALLNISGVSGANLTLVSNAGGVASFHYSNPAAQSGTLVLGQVLAQVPDSAASQYQAKELLQLGNVVLNQDPSIAALGDAAVHVNAYLGDTTGNGTITGGDVVLVSRVPGGLDSGFAAFPTVDPVILADLTGDGLINATEIGQFNRYVANLSHVFIPVPPGLSITPTGADPALSIPTDLQASAGGVVTVPVNIDDPHPAGSTGLTDATLALTYDPKLFSVSAGDIRLGSVPLSGSGWKVSAQIDAATGQIGINLYSPVPITSAQAGSLVTIDFHALGAAGSSAINLVPGVTLGGRAFGTTLSDSAGLLTLHALPLAATQASAAQPTFEPGAAPPTPPAEEPIEAAVIMETKTDETVDGRKVQFVDPALAVTDLEMLPAAEPVANRATPSVNTPVLLAAAGQLVDPLAAAQTHSARAAKPASDVDALDGLLDALVADVLRDSAEADDVLSDTCLR